MTTSMVPSRYRVSGRHAETRDTVTLAMEPVDEPIATCQPGQFTMLLGHVRPPPLSPTMSWWTSSFVAARSTAVSCSSCFPRCWLQARDSRAQRRLRVQGTRQRMCAGCPRHPLPRTGDTAGMRCHLPRVQPRLLRLLRACDQHRGDDRPARRDGRDPRLTTQRQRIPSHRRVCLCGSAPPRGPIECAFPPSRQITCGVGPG